MKTLHIHLWMPKTDGCAMENFCWENKKALEEQGYCCLKVLEEVCGNEKDGKNFQTVVQMICESLQNYDHALLFDQGRWCENSKESEAVWRRLKQTAEQEGFCICVTAYLCQRDIFLHSFQGQMMQPKEEREKSFEEYMELFGMSARLACYQGLDQIAEIIGKENLTVLNFDEKKLASGKLYKEFLKTIGLRMTEKYRIQKNVKSAGLCRDGSVEKRPFDIDLKLRDDVVRFSGLMAAYLYQEEQELKKEIQEMAYIRRPVRSVFRWIKKRIRKK